MVSVTMMVVAAVLAIPSLSNAEPVDPELIRETAVEVLENRSFQTELPDDDSATDNTGASRSMSSSRRWGNDRGAIEVRPVHAVGFTTLLFWIGLGTILALLIVWAVNEGLMMIRRERLHRSIPEDLTSGRSRSVRLGFDQAVNLAAAGDLAAAVRCLLAASLDHLSSSGTVVLRTSTTGREALRQVEGRSQLGRQLAVLVAAVEHSCFGGMALTRDDYRRCRAAVATILEDAEAGP